MTRCQGLLVEKALQRTQVETSTYLNIIVWVARYNQTFQSFTKKDKHCPILPNFYENPFNEVLSLILSSNFIFQGDIQSILVCITIWNLLHE